MNKDLKIPDHIKTLLFEYSPVIVPELGAFTTRYKPAQLNEALGRISPPIKTLEFNPAVKVDDGLLVGHIARQLKVSESIAELEVKWFVNSLLATVERDGRVVINGLGEFSADKSGKLTFNTLENQNYSTDTYGLEAVSLNNDNNAIPSAGIGLSGINEKKETIHIDTQNPLPQNKHEENKDEPPSTFADVLLAPPPNIKKEEQTNSGTLFEQLSNNETTGNSATIGRSINEILAANDDSKAQKKNVEKKQKGGLGIWAWLLPLLMLGLFALLIWRMASNKSSLSDNKTQITEIQHPSTQESYNQEPATATTTNTSDTVIQQTTEETTTAIATNETTTNNSPEETVLGPNQKMIDGLRITESTATEYANGKQTTMGYYIIVGSWKNKTKAQEVATQYKGYGYKTHLLETMTGNIRIGIYGPQDIPTIKQEFAIIREKYNPDAWVMRFN